MNRSESPDSKMLADIEAELLAGRQATAQWAAPLKDSGVLAEVNRLCARFGALLEVRFYGWYREAEGFDAAVLEAIPEVRRLTLNCLERASNLAVLSALPALEDLHLGIRELPDGTFLETLPLERLTRLGLEENRKRNFDLAPLADCRALERLFIQGHARGIASCSALGRLRELGLSGMPKGLPLDFVNSIAPLRALRLLLGSRTSIAELAHPALDSLSIDWVRGLESLGDLGRFPALRELFVEDQLLLQEIDLTGTRIERLRLSNCKNLAAIVGLDSLDRLEWFHASRTKLDLDALRDRNWPTTTRSVGLFSGSRKWNEAAEATLAAKGIPQFPHVGG